MTPSQLSGLAIGAAVLIGGPIVLAYLEWSASRRGRRALSVAVTELGLLERDVALPPSQYGAKRTVRGVVGPSEVVLFVTPGNKYSPETCSVAVSQGQTGHRWVWGPYGMLHWLTIVRQGSAWTRTWFGLSLTTTGDPVFDQGFVVAQITGYSNWTGGVSDTRPVALSQRVKDALSRASLDVHVRFDGVTATVMAKGWHDTPAGWRELYEVARAFADDPPAFPTGAPHEAPPSRAAQFNVAFVILAIALTLVSAGAALAFALVR